MSEKRKILVKKKLNDALIELKTDSPFSYYFLRQLRFEECELVPVCAINLEKKIILYNPMMIEKLKMESVKFALLHELTHLLSEGWLRKGNREESIWLIAEDGVINEQLLRRISWNEDMEIVRGEMFVDVSFEEAYEKLKNNEQKLEEYLKLVNSLESWYKIFKEGLGLGSLESEKDKSDNSREKNQKIKEKIDSDLERMTKNAIKQYQEQCKKEGRESDGFGLSGLEPQIIKEYILKKIKTRYDFTSLFKKKLVDILKIKETWKYPHHLSYSVGKYLPSVNGSKIKTVIAIDTSGSIDNEEAREFLGITDKLLKTRNVEAYIIQCDEKILSIEKARGNVEKMPIRRGTGGTSFVPVFEKCLEIRPKLLIYLTDCEGEYPEKKKYPFKVIWITKEDKKHFAEKAKEYGQVIFYSDEDLEG